VLNKEDLEATRDIMEKYGRLDILINAGAICPVLPLVLIKRFTICIGPFAKGIRFKYHWNHIASQVFSEILRDKNRESSSIFHQLQLKGLCLVVGYSASKAAIDNFTKWMSVELAGKYGEGLRVNAIAPGFY
jgi:NAD(P)-dependent dehydrogenase (short-subunit alcohol dehydrogenase family)